MSMVRTACRGSQTPTNYPALISINRLIVTHQDVQQLELYCKQLYESSNPGEAEKALVAFQDSPDALPRCQQLLDRAGT